MILVPAGVRVHIALGVTDMRKERTAWPCWSREC